MNGRVYDPILGQFMQADNFVQELIIIRKFIIAHYIYQQKERELAGMQDGDKTGHKTGFIK